MKIFLSFIGNNDCCPYETPGAILTILGKKPFDAACLLYNHEKYLKPADDIRNYCREHYPDLAITLRNAPSENPIDYTTVYPAMYQAVRKIINRFGKADYTISLTSGTPVMHACWIFLQKGGLIDAKLIQVSRDGDISEVTFELDDFPEIRQTDVVKAEMTRLARENRQLKHRLGLTHDAIIGACPGILKVKEQIAVFADAPIPVFIRGETGTGKELVAESLHYNSSRKEKPMVRVNCGAIPSELFESEFFGHKKGAFTGAVSDNQGKFKQADGGTVFLDEIADLPPAMQVKLLRFLDQGTFMPVGTSKEDRSDVRIISATHKDLRRLVTQGIFREDLFYRLVHTEICLPPLRERGNDKALIATHLLEGLNRKYGKTKTLSPSALRLILKAGWQGNIRQLKNAIETAYMFPGDEIAAENMTIIEIESPPDRIVIPDDGVDLNNDILPKYYEAALNKTGGNAEQAARLLGLKAHTFRARLKAVKENLKNKG